MFLTFLNSKNTYFPEHLSMIASEKASLQTNTCWKSIIETVEQGVQ